MEIFSFWVLKFSIAELKAFFKQIDYVVRCVEELAIVGGVKDEEEDFIICLIFQSVIPVVKRYLAAVLAF